MVSPLQAKLGIKTPLSMPPEGGEATAEAGAPPPAGRRGRTPRHTQPERTPIRATAPVTDERHRLRPIEDYFAIEHDEEADPLHIPRHLIPEGFTLQWVADSVYGATDPARRAGFEKKGWVSVMQSEFQGVFDGRWMKKGQPGEIVTGGLVLMARPEVFTKKARFNDWAGAQNRMAIRKQQLAAGDIPGVTLDSRHKTALGFNYVKNETERLPMRQIKESDAVAQAVAAGQFDIPSAVRRQAQPQPWE
jgi:hypothetical protein